jgi:capsule biosynthesis phosphatase
MDRKLRICIDLDGTVCDFRREGETYADVRVKPGAAEAIRGLRAAGHEVIINTARNMGSADHNVGKAIKNVGRITLEWLDRNGIEFDEIFFGKPNADITIDDRVIRFEDNWAEMTEERLAREAREQ